MGIEDQSYQNGLVTGFNGASGLLEALRTFVLGTEVTAENLSGSGVSWSGTLANSPVGLGRLVINYTVSGTPYEATDNGAGVITGNYISAGSITYETGVYSVTFSSAPTGTPNADYLYGNPGQDWRELDYRNAKDNVGVDTPRGADTKEMVWHNTGISGQENIILGFREWYYTAEDRHGWDLNGYINYIQGQLWDANSAQHAHGAYSTTYHSYNNHPQIPLIDDQMYYWFFANRQRIIVVVKVQSNYESIYMGFGLRYGTPSEYPYPLEINGSATGCNRFSATGSTRLYICENYFEDNGYSVWCVDPSGQYKICDGNDHSAAGTRRFPKGGFANTTNIMEKTPTDDLVHLQNNYIVDLFNDETYFQLDGVYHLASANVQSEDILHANGIKHRIFQNIHRTDYWQFMAIEQEAGTTTTTTTSTTVTTTTVTGTTTTTTV